MSKNKIHYFIICNSSSSWNLCIQFVFIFAF